MKCYFKIKDILTIFSGKYVRQSLAVIILLSCYILLVTFECLGLKQPLEWLMATNF